MAKTEQQDFERALRGELPCPDCGGPMPSPIQVTEKQGNGVPRSFYVCRHCHRQRQQKVRTGVAWQMQLGVA